MTGDGDDGKRGLHKVPGSSSVGGSTAEGLTVAQLAAELEAANETIRLLGVGVAEAVAVSREAIAAQIRARPLARWRAAHDTTRMLSCSPSCFCLRGCRRRLPVSAAVTGGTPSRAE